MNRKSKAAKDKKVSRSCVEDWMEQKAQLEAQLKASSSCSISSSKRLQGAGRPLKDKDFDEKLINWVRQQRQKKLRVSRTMIQKEALTLSIDENFKASNDWLEKFHFVTTWFHAAQRRLVRRSRRSTLRR